MIHGARRRGRAVAASPPHMKDRGLRESMKIKGGTNAPEHLSADRFETDGAETQLSPTTMPIDAINGFGSIRTFKGILTFMTERVRKLRCAQTRPLDAAFLDLAPGLLGECHKFPSAPH